jgi:IS5 family transposase
MPGMPCNATELVHFRKRIGVEGFNLIFKMSVALHGKQAQESSVLILLRRLMILMASLASVG